MLDRLMNEERGFTLVELLVTISILAVLFGIVTLTLSGVGSNAQTEVCNAELGVVQSAMDIFLAEDADNTIAAQGTAGTITGTSGANAFTDYIRGTTLGEYTWDADGENLNQASCPAS